MAEKVEAKGTTNYNDVADELVRELAADAAAGLGEGSYDEKNIRRRVYDALNVLEALGMIDKGKKDIQWLGWPPALGQSAKHRLEAEHTKLAARVAHKAAMAAAVCTKTFCLSNLVLRNHDAPLSVMRAAQEMGLGAPTPLTLPFMLVHAPADAAIDVHISDDQRSASLEFYKSPFQVFDDEGVMRMMGLGEPRPELQTVAAVAEVAARMRPSAQSEQELSAVPEGSVPLSELEQPGITPTKVAGSGVGGGAPAQGRHVPELSPSAVSAMGLESPMTGVTAPAVATGRQSDPFPQSITDMGL